MRVWFLACVAIGVAVASGCSDSSVPSDPVTAKRFADLDAVKAALAKFHDDTGSYPISQGWDGYPSQWGASTPEWIKGLAPKYIDKLPLDAGYQADPPSEYLYKSDGKDYKLLAHQTSDCQAVKAAYPAMQDANRDCWAYGYWTEGAQNW